MKRKLTVIFLITSLTSLIFLVEVDETPVAIMSMSISPVFGSVALYYIAVLIRRTASSISDFATVSERRIFATDSASLIIDSSYLGVAVIVFLLLPKDRILRYSLTST